MQMKNQRIVAVHLLNDFSGSPFVFSQALQALQQNGGDVHLFTATPSGNGFLNNITGIKKHNILYRWSKIKLVTLFLYLYSQLSLFVKLLIFTKSTDIVYINSILPFGAAWAGRCKGCKVIYHIHEVSIKPALLKKWLLYVINKIAHRCIYVSKYVQQFTPVHKEGVVIYNALPQSFIDTAATTQGNTANTFTVLMLCSLKKYKGVDEFVAAARLLPALHFELVLNANQQAIAAYFHNQILPANITVHAAQSNVHPFYAKASVVVNLSLPQQWVETFGMTVLEAMYYRKPVIVPQVGGVSELVLHGVTGFCEDSRDVNSIVLQLQKLFEDKVLYTAMSNAAYQQALQFNTQQFNKAITQTIAQCAGPISKQLPVQRLDAA
jgi:L-malate glycosyltransferase